MDVSIKTQKAVKNAGDVVKGGVLHCGVCGEPKEYPLTIGGRVRLVRCLCRCETTSRDQAEEERKKQERIEKVQRLKTTGFADRDMMKCTFEAADGSNEKLEHACKAYTDNFSTFKAKGRGLLLFGAVGTGKTFLACCIANRLMEQGIPCMVTNFGRIINTLEAIKDKQAYIDSLNQFQLLVIDDLAAERDTEYMGEAVQNIIDARYRSGLPLIVTTNLTREQLRRPADIRKQRIYSRLFEMCVPIEVKGADRRKVKLKEDIKELNQLLGIGGTE